MWNYSRDLLERDSSTWTPGPADQDFWGAVRAIAEQLGSDGCTGIPDFYVGPCFRHDIHYRTHADLAGRPLSRHDADRRFRLGIQAHSPFGVLSPMSYWRWAGVRLFGRRAWNG